MNIFEKEKFNRVQTLEKEEERRETLNKNVIALMDASVPLTFIKRCNDALLFLESDTYSISCMSLKALDACIELRNKLDNLEKNPLTFRMIFRLGTSLRQIGDYNFWRALEGHKSNNGMSLYSMFKVDVEAGLLNREVMERMSIMFSY